MASWATSYNFNDKETNIGIKTFTDIVQNTVYTARTDLENTLLGLNLSKFTNLESLTGELKSVLDNIMNLPSKIMGEIKASIDRIVNMIMGLPFVGYIKDLFQDLKDRDEDGLKSWLTDEVQAGNWILCNNLDVIQGLLDGIHFPETIIDGMFISVSLGWLNRTCKDLTPEEEMGMTNRQILESTNPYRGVEMAGKEAKATNIFISNVSGYLRDQDEVKRLTLNETEIMSNIKSDNFNNYADEISPFLYRGDKEEILEIIDRNINNNSLEGDDLLRAFRSKSRVNLLPTYGKNHVSQAKFKPKGKDALGSTIKNLNEIDLTKVPSSRDPVEESIRKKMFVVKGMANTADFLSRTHAEGQFTNFDFKEILELFTEEEITFIKSKPQSTDSVRYNNLHPTTETFVEDFIPRVRKKPIQKPSRTSDDYTGRPSLEGYNIA